MNREDMQTLFTYDAWADRRILNCLAKLAPGQWDAPLPVSHGSIKGILVHALSAKWIWRQRAQGKSPDHFLNPDEFPTPQSLDARFQQESQALQALLASLQDEDFDRTLIYTNKSGIAKQNLLGHVLLHVINHGTQHRSEAAQLLTSLGHSPGDLDLIVFLREPN